MSRHMLEAHANQFTWIVKIQFRHGTADVLIDGGSLPRLYRELISEKFQTKHSCVEQLQLNVLTLTE